MNIEDDARPCSVSLCTAAMDRLHHLRKTLPANIIANRNCPRLQFVIVDYSSHDGLADWIYDEMTDYLESGLVLFAQLRDRRVFHMAHAKNIAHRLGRGDVLCNLDADNFSALGFATFLSRIFNENPWAYVRGVGHGVGGRIALPREHFHALGGYDETMQYGWGYEDADLVARAMRWGLQGFYYRRCGRSISHDNDERTKNYDVKNTAASCKRHRRISKSNLSAGRLVANPHVSWGSGQILVNFRTYISL
jgi:hypothetical protein